jgi:hypothetical protein
VRFFPYDAVSHGKVAARTSSYVRIMGDDEQRDPIIIQRFQEAQHGLAIRYVEIPGRLIAQHKSGPSRYRAGYRHALTLAPR